MGAIQILRGTSQTSFNVTSLADVCLDTSALVCPVPMQSNMVGATAASGEALAASSIPSLVLHAPYPHHSFSARTSSKPAKIRTIASPRPPSSRGSICRDNSGLPANVLVQRVQRAAAGDQYACSLSTRERLIGEASARAGNGNDSSNNDDKDKPTSTKPPANTSTDNGGVINVGDKPTDAPTPEPISASSGDEDSEYCNDSAPECKKYNDPAVGDTCDKHVALHVLALGQLSQLHQLGLELIEVSIAPTVQSKLLPHRCPLLSCYLPSPFLPSVAPTLLLSFLFACDSCKTFDSNCLLRVSRVSQ